MPYALRGHGGHRTYSDSVGNMTSIRVISDLLRAKAMTTVPMQARITAQRSVIYAGRVQSKGRRFASLASSPSVLSAEPFHM